MSSSDLYSDIGPTHDGKQVVARTIGLLKKYFGCTDRKLLGKGSFGAVMRFKRPQGGDDAAIKCLVLDGVREGERKLRLRHSNLVTLFRSTTFWPLTVSCFEMHVFPKDLMTAVRKDEYLDSPEALQQLKTWLYQVLWISCTTSSCATWT
ncbi:hypothetical protein AVEN_7428-1 [Araneus ventricosus]|uniref:Protein kinase domain-containing protein n=1 Tax=Araneus ventricosus TaxID=182803 RepID=A0A4Y2GZ24_ARAVE|nr:hypothetical protein AVEN_7428-1 [Araneus ventricosus]